MTDGRAGMPSSKNGTAFDLCVQDMRDRDPDRYACALFAGDKHLAAMIGLLSFHHELAHSRDDVSEAMIGDIRLQWWRDALDGIFAGTPRKHPTAELLAEVAESQVLDRRLLDSMIDGRAECHNPDGIQTWQDLEDWIYKTSGRLAETMLSVMGVTDANSHAAMRHVVVGYGLTGMARAVAAMGRQGNVVLPRQEMKALGLAPEAIMRGKEEENLPVLIYDMLDIANGHLAEARKLRSKIDPQAISVLLQARLADYYIVRTKKAGYSFENPVQIGALRRQLRLTRAWMTRRF